MSSRSELNMSSTCTTQSRFTHSVSQTHRQRLHPLELYAPGTVDVIEFVDLSYIEAETTRAPIPRNQDLPKEVFGRLNGRSVLVATSHAWFYQCHPDPHGAKLEILRKEFCPRLRRRFPHTRILMFDDWMSCPQFPRVSRQETLRFQACMDGMNSIYCYCDVVLFVDAPFPDLDNTVFSCDLNPSEHKWLQFIDTIQYGEGDVKALIQQNDIVISTNNLILTLSNLYNTNTLTTIFFLRRPYGRPNRIPAEERGWLYAERITVAIRMAAANPEYFNDVVMSNSGALVKQIFIWSDTLRDAARLEKVKPGSVRSILHHFKTILSKKKFGFRENDMKTVDELLTDLVTQFETNWDEESRRQKNMASRAREILLRWGSFSDDYIERAELLCDSSRHNNEKKTRNDILCGFSVAVLAPSLATIPFVFNIENVDPSKDGIFISSLWLGALSSCGAVGAIPVGMHFILAISVISLMELMLSYTMRTFIGTIVPFEAAFVGLLGLFCADLVFGMIKVVPVKDSRTDQIKRWALGTWLHMPASLRFDLKARADVKRVLQTTQFAVLFALAYPLLGGLFFQSGIVIQALLIPVFFLVRAGFEYGADAITSHAFGSDGMPAINFTGVLMHEICLSVMITSIKHPLVFVSLVLSDVLENSFCLWSLARNTKNKSNRVSPDDNSSKKNYMEKSKPSFTRRSSNVMSLVMRNDAVSDKGTALFIAATLLQREAVETLVPMQAFAILTLLYRVDVKTNSIVNGWNKEDWAHSMTYIGVDLAIELIVFAGTIQVLRTIYPEFNATRILRGLLRTHWVEMTILSFSVWVVSLMYQSTLSGVDMTMKFSWLSCHDAENSTWLGGFEWEC